MDRQRLLLVAAVLVAGQGGRADWTVEEALNHHRQGGSLRGHAHKGKALSLTRDPRVVATTDTRGNLGPASVLVQPHPGGDWLHDRWQAASDMGGTAIPGQHWVEIDLGRPVTARECVLDWEAAYSDSYTIYAKLRSEDEWIERFDGAKPEQQSRRRVYKHGQSPGVPNKEVPLHVEHTVDLGKSVTLRYLRIAIFKPGAGWGVSLWQVDLYGTEGAAETASVLAGKRTGRHAAHPLNIEHAGGEGGEDVAALDSSDLKVLADDWTGEGHAPRVRCATTKGEIVIQIRPSWAPIGAERFLALVRDFDFFTANGGVGLFRTVKNFICQFGVPGDPAVFQRWKRAGRIKDDPQWLDMSLKRRMKKGMISFAGGGRDSRGMELFIALADVRLGGAAHEVPFGHIVEGLDVIDQWYSGYGDLSQFGGHAPSQGRIYHEGNDYLRAEFPLLDYITECEVI